MGVPIGSKIRLTRRPAERCPRHRLCTDQEAASLHFVLYDWTHTFATEMAQAGVDLATLAAILGHSSLRVVQEYVHPTADRIKQAMRTFEDALAVTGGLDEPREQGDQLTLKTTTKIRVHLWAQSWLLPLIEHDRGRTEVSGKPLNLKQIWRNDGGAGRDRTDA
jgi:hypothetical protein